MTTSIKTCFKCYTEKPTTEFYKHQEMADGLLGKCKQCTKKDTIKNRADNQEHYREYDRTRGSRRSYADTQKYRKNFPEKYKAHQFVGNAIRSGQLQRQQCESCGSQKSHAHHDDYAKPSEVRWLCAGHHQQWHAINGEGKNGTPLNWNVESYDTAL